MKWHAALLRRSRKKIISGLAPRLFALVANKRTVFDALTHLIWTSDIQGALSVSAVAE